MKYGAMLGAQLRPAHYNSPHLTVRSGVDVEDLKALRWCRNKTDYPASPYR